MSGLINGAQPNIRIGAHDWRAVDPNWQLMGALFAECIDAVAPPTFESEWWPGSGGAGEGGVDVPLLSAVRWGSYSPASGASSAYGVAGITRDQYGSAIGGVTVKLFLTATDTLLDTQVSDVTTGAFTLRTVYYPNTHYLTAFKAGSPGVQGVTVNTLIGA